MSNANWTTTPVYNEVGEFVDPHERARAAERTVLGAMMRESWCIPDVLRIVRGQEAFSIHAHQLIFAAIIENHSNANPVDAGSIAQALYAAGKIEDAGGPRYLAHLLDHAPTSATSEYMARVVLNSHVVRSAHHAAIEMAEATRNLNADGVEVVNEFSTRLAALAERQSVDEPVDLRVALEHALEAIELRTRNQQESGTPTGFADLDKIIVGLQPGELVGIAARPSVGKTALGAAMAVNIAASGRSVLFASLEQSRQEIVERVLANVSLTDSHLMRTGRLSAAMCDNLVKAAGMMKAWRLHIDDSSSITVPLLHATARRLQRKRGLDVVFIDYLQFVSPDDRREKRYEQVGGIARRLKQMARDLKIPVVAMIMVGRGSGDGEEKPRLSDLRESGDIEANIDVCLMLWRIERQAERELIGVDVAKNRNGRTGDLALVHAKRFLRFENYQQGVGF